MSVHITGSRKQLIRRGLDALIKLGVIDSYDIQSNMPGLRWVVYGLPSYGTGRAYSTNEVEAFLDGAQAVVVHVDKHWMTP